MPDDLPPEESAATDGEALCLACGLCCKGIWFPHVKLKPGEVEIARAAQFPVETVGKDVVFYQPCVKHQGGKCDAYAQWRPAACSDFRCRLLDAYVKGEVSMADALRHVDAASAMAEEMRHELGDVKGGLRGDEFVACLHADASGADGRPMQLTAATKLNAVALNMYYVKYFRKSKPELLG
jgi:hypothetical protein